MNWPSDPFRPSAEQAAIVRYLDHADRRISRYIRAKQRLIELLEEEKQVIIHRAVTRGLDPDVPLKPSGVEWLGDVPEHWEVRKLGVLFSSERHGSGTTPSGDDLLRRRNSLGDDRGSHAMATLTQQSNVHRDLRCC